VVLPVHDVNPLRRTPYVTWLLVAINVFVFVALEPVADTISGQSKATAQAVCAQERFFYEYGAIPEELTGGHQLDSAPTGQVIPISPSEVACAADTPKYDKHPVLSVLEAMFLHGGWLHLLGNMLFLVVFGNNVEDRMGRLRYLIFYLVCGYAAAYGFAVTDPHSTTPLVGASGAIAGVLGAYLVLFPRARVVSLLTFLFFLPVVLPAWIVLGGWFLLQWAYASGFGLASGSDVAYMAHVAGFVVGVILVLPWVDRLRGGLSQPPRPRRSGQRAYDRLRDSGWWA
jgi:membrane associated rhomboid family serine protease